jgi:hypothetical protein
VAGEDREAPVETGDVSAQALCINGTPEQVYEPLLIVELGGPDSL